MSRVPWSVSKPENMVGRHFGRRVVLSKAARHDTWNVRCDCGTEGVARGNHLRSGAGSSCGCLKIERSAAARTTHGATTKHGKSTEYEIWAGMLKRCTNPRSRYYADYGGRGITVCERWLKDFAAFLADMGRRPSAAHSLDRKDNDVGYSPENCRWATRKEQNRNRRNNLILTVNGESLPAAAWEERMGLPKGNVSHRITAGWTPSEAVLTPVKGQRARGGDGAVWVTPASAVTA